MVEERLVIHVTILRILVTDGEETMSKPLIEERVTVTTLEEVLSKITELVNLGIKNMFRFL